MPPDRSQWTAIAESLLERACLRAPAEPEELAALLGLNLVRRLGPGVELVGREIRYDASAEGARRQRLISEGVARWGLRSCLVPASDLAIHAVVAALRAGAPVVASRSEAF